MRAILSESTVARILPSGTPTRSKRYLSPVDTRRRWALAGMAGLGIVAALMGLYVLGAARFLSPGDLAAEHASIDLECAQCHNSGLVSGGVIGLRCERCHDIGASDRLTNPAHVLFGSADALKADAAVDVACTQCHVDHYGRDWTLTTVDDRECAACHQFRVLGRHPEFAAISASIQTGLGMKFGHDRHIVEAVNAGLDQCRACHVPTVDQMAFEPVGFDDHCAACHTDEGGFVTGNSDPIGPDYVLTPDQISEPWANEVEIQTVEAARGRAEFTRMRHADRWTLYNARRLRRAIDPAGEASEREALQVRITYLEQQATTRPLAAAGAVGLDAWSESLQREVAELERRLETSPAPETDLVALEAIAVATRALAGAVAATAGEVAPDVTEDELSGEVIVTNEETTAGSTAEQFEARRNELLELLVAVSRRGDDELVDRAETLRAQVDDLRPQTGAQDTAAYRDGLQALDDIVRIVRGVPDPQARFEAAELDALRGLARQQVTGGLAPDEFEDRRRQLLSLLTAIDRDGDVTLRARAAPLRQRVAALRAGADGDRALERQLRRRRRDLDRVRLESELAEFEEAPPTGSAAPVRDRAAGQAELERLRAQLAALEGGSRPGVALGDDRERQAFALESLLTPCLKCHELSGPALAPVTIAEPVMTRARFDHAPHVILTDCAACHASVTSSGLATDVNVPGVDNCQSCHRPDEARADCATCHVYHPPSVAALLRAP